MKTLIGVITGCALLVGCAAPGYKPLYVWNNYSNSLYLVKKNPGAESLANHKGVLTKIVADSAASGTRVPPGVYAELGFIQIKEGLPAEGVGNLKMEMSIYPESAVFINRLISSSENASRSNTNSGAK